MKNDVFISYSRVDFDEVNEFVEMLKQQIPSLSVWFDITGIECMQSVSDVLSFLFALPFTFYFLNGLKNKNVGESHLNYYDGE